MNLKEIYFDNIRNKKPITDASINEKKRQKKAIKNALDGNIGYNVKTFAIFTSESSPKDKERWKREGNDDNKELVGRENKVVHHELSRSLKKYGYAVEPVVGYYGDEPDPKKKWKIREHSFIVLNISLENTKYYAGLYEQQSFIFWSNGVAEYWQMENDELPYDPKTNKYIKVDEVKGYKEVPQDQESYYTIIGKDFKFTIPFPIFDAVHESVELGLQTYFENDRTVLDYCIDCNFSNQVTTLFRKKLNERVSDSLIDMTNK